jgi:sarcosine oxidase delta subunit
MLAKNAVEAGLLDCYVRLTTGRLKIFRSLKKTQAELRLYRRNEKGKIVKENDHLMDCMRYLVATLDDLVQAWQPPGVPKATRNRGEGGWMGQ